VVRTQIRAALAARQQKAVAIVAWLLRARGPVRYAMFIRDFRPVFGHGASQQE